VHVLFPGKRGFLCLNVLGISHLKTRSQERFMVSGFFVLRIEEDYCLMAVIARHKMVNQRGVTEDSIRLGRFGGYKGSY
jgi:hypothetical protein